MSLFLLWACPLLPSRCRPLCGPEDWQAPQGLPGAEAQTARRSAMGTDPLSGS